ncbi:MAG TPA: BON domain-containing protein [Candidatus Saccharimonadales bacterium]|nr:BON domain-containing protein [Candidatus Saccharimonadales bacterium]
MKMTKKLLCAALLSLTLFALGCSKIGLGSKSDAQIASDIQTRILADSNIPDKQISISANGGVVTLSGSVSSDMARSAAANDAALADGVKTVVNNLQVGPATAANLPASQPDSMAANDPPPAYRPAPSHGRNNSGARGSSADNGQRRNPAPSSNGGDEVARNTAPPAPQRVTIPSGTQLNIRVNEEVSSEKAQIGDTFHGSIASPVTVDDQTVIPTTADVEGRVVEVRSAGRFAGQSVLTLELTKLVMNGRSYSIQTGQWTKAGSGRGKATAAKVGGGAAVGAVLGGIFGGGKGAAIGAAAGAGAGTGVSAATKGQQIVLKPEASVAFQLTGPLTVTPGTSRQSMH